MNVYLVREFRKERGEMTMMKPALTNKDVLTCWERHTLTRSILKKRDSIGQQQELERPSP